MTKNNILTAVYDLSVSPVGFDFVTFMAIADALRLDKKLESFYVLVIPGEGTALSGNDFAVFHGEQFSVDHARWRISNIFLPMFAMHPNCCGVTFCQSREHGRKLVKLQGVHFYPEAYDIDNPPSEYWTDFESTIMANTGYEFPGFKAPKQALDYVDQWLKTRSGNKKIISITMREGYHGIDKNSDVDVWVEFAKSLDPNEYFIVFLPDIETAFTLDRPEIKEFTQFTEVVFNLLLRVAFYERCYLSLFTSCGPISICYYNGATRFINFKAVPPTYHAKVPFEITVGVDIHENQPWSTPYQKRISAPENFELVTNEFNEMVKRIEANKKEAFSRLALKQRSLGPENLSRIVGVLTKDSLSSRAVRLCHKYIKRHPDQIPEVIDTLCLADLRTFHMDTDLFECSQKFYAQNLHLEEGRIIFTYAKVKIAAMIGDPSYCRKLTDLLPDIKEILNDDELVNKISLQVASQMFRLQKPSESIPLLKRANSIFQTRDTLYGLGVIYAKINKPNEALDAFNQLLTSGYEHKSIYEYMGNIYKVTGQTKLAIEYLHKSLFMR